MLNLLNLRFKLLKDDKWMIIIMIAMTLVLTFVFTSSMSGDYKPSAVLIDYDNSDVSRQFTDELNNSLSINFRLENIEKGQELIEKGNVIGGLIIPEGFKNDIINNKNINLELIKTKDSLEIFQMQNTVRSEVFKLKSNYNTAVATVNILKKEGLQTEEEQIEKIYQIGVEHWEYRNPITLKSSLFEVESDWAYNPRIHYLVGFTLFFATFTIVFVAGDILKEKQQHTWYRKLISPIEKWKIMTSLLITTFIVGFTQMLIMVLAGRYIFQINWGMNVIFVLGIYAAFVFTFTSIGLTISGLVKNYEQLGSIVPIVLVASAMIGGTMWPLEIINSKVLLTLSNLMPHKWAMEILTHTAAYGFNVSMYLRSFSVLTGMGLIYLAIGIKLVSVKR
ncbi:MAG: ABC transporter permease [Bacillota bacterium]|nr:ABC transporter permease [Bacillota bacterium]